MGGLGLSVESWAPKLLKALPLRYRILVKAVLFLSQFKLFRYTFGENYFWVVTNKEFPKEIHTEDPVVVNNQAKPGQISKVKLVCDGTPPRVKCRWVFDIKE